MTKMDSLEAFRNEYRLMLDKAAKWLLFIILGLGALQVIFFKVKQRAKRTKGKTLDSQTE